MDWEAQTTAAKRILEAYSSGINAALETQPQAYEFRQLGGHQPEKWTPVDSLAVLKMVSDTGQWAVKRDHGVILQALGPKALNAIVPDLPQGTSVHVPPGAQWTGEHSEYHLLDGLESDNQGYQVSGLQVYSRSIHCLTCSDLLPSLPSLGSHPPSYVRWIPSTRTRAAVLAAQTAGW
jgi:acyl-homoserine lactone acylase PvdQ